jgi:hypothetical protein
MGAGMATDIRDLDRIEHADILALNFIRSDAPYVFRRHFRNGLRSRIIEVLEPQAVALECRGTIVDGVRCFPRARPVKMLRIFRTRFADLDQALGETRRLKAVEAHLAPGFIAASSEFYVDYRCGRRRQILLCGLQDYIHGVALDPWQAGCRQYLTGLQRRLVDETGEALPPEAFGRRLLEELDAFVTRVQRLMHGTGLVPDLAGTRNLLVTGDGRLHLVDINNIHPLNFGETVPLDDKGYPVMDKSIEALDLLARHLLRRDELRQTAAWRIFFTAERRSRVRAAEGRFRAAVG